MSEQKKRHGIFIDEGAYQKLHAMNQEVFPGRSMTSVIISAVMLYCRLQKLGKLHEVSSWGVQDTNGNTNTGAK